MAYNLLGGDRDQPFLLPPDLRDWLPDGHLAWFILDVTDQFDLEPFLCSYRADGHEPPGLPPRSCAKRCGRPARGPAVWRRSRGRAAQALASKTGRLACLRQAKAQLEAEPAARRQPDLQPVAAHTAAATAKGRTPSTLKPRPQEAPEPSRRCPFILDRLHGTRAAPGCSPPTGSSHGSGDWPHNG
jgi:hypothetical protein